ncbi:hypothetical protein L202_01903 [Cryptococcus amylolentus CBS 6039]|uniref:Uncharacterized protein n=1 Tax=Cryptococcus amylolentus CBS 6039 TaxID=1295533 RepID=A0A1E3HZ15_9TREE|nr:hypothetical protein L202_01903 [Cryptococcus amylolentus CBS 6039]ODN81478.1 hypothetical protein L202_01903 [Cryptococcus amylolentus CBS 6039]
MTSISLRPAHFAPDPILDSHPTMKNASPFQTTLYLKHLPPSIKPKHFDLILGQPPRRDGSKGRKRETGIKMVQIYTIPAHSSPAPSPSTRHTSPLPLVQRGASTLPAVLRAILCLSSRPDSDRSQTPPVDALSKVDKSRERRVSDESHHEVIRRRSTGGESGIEVIEGPDYGRPSSSFGELERITEEEVVDPYGDDAEELEGETPAVARENDENQGFQDSEKEEEEGEIVAYIHFCCDNHLYSAKRILGHLTIDGYRPTISTKRFDSGLVKRWAGPISGGSKEK